jgi:catechol 2,3-dioxygenase-like lactoylglutathione lyase family enzyme
MLGYVTIGALDSEASGKFYDAVFGAMGAERKFADGGWIGYGPKGSDAHSVYVCPPAEDSTTFYGAYFRDPTGNKICVFCKP